MPLLLPARLVGRGKTTHGEQGNANHTLINTVSHMSTLTIEKRVTYKSYLAKNRCSHHAQSKPYQVAYPPNSLEQKPTYARLTHVQVVLINPSVLQWF